MAFVLAIEGFHGAGKSALIAGLRSRRSDYLFFDDGRIPQIEDLRVDRRLRADIEGDYYEIERAYVDFEVQRFATFRESDFVVMARGPELREFYFLHHPVLLRKNWDVERRFAAELLRFRSCRSNRILYLDASTEQINARLRARGESQLSPEWLNDRGMPSRRYLLALPKTRLLVTDHLSAAEVVEQTIRWIDTGCEIF